MLKSLTGVRTMRIENQRVGSQETVAALCAVLEVERTQILAPQVVGRPDKLLRNTIVILSAVLLGMAIGSLNIALLQ